MALPPLDDEVDASLCPRCGTPFTSQQEYCLECGLRLASTRGVVGTLSTAWQDRLPWYPGDWIWPVLLGLLIAVIAATAAIIFADSGGGGRHPFVATQQGQPQTPVTPTETVALPTVPRGTPTTTGPSPVSTSPSASTKPKPAAGSLTPWPASQDGYTVVLESIPTGTGRSFALGRAKAAAHAGLTTIGVLDSAGYSSLHPGYYVVFSGILSSKSQADSAAAKDRARGFASAYSRQITH